MGVALSRPDPSEHHLGMVHIAEAALTAIGVTIQYSTELAADVAGDWNGYTRTVIIRADAHPLHQVWHLEQVLTLLLRGPAATPAAHHERRLVLVPPLPSDS